jgi:thiol-disulfide isomerase/thioredoxin
MTLNITRICKYNSSDKLKHLIVNNEDIPGSFKEIDVDGFLNSFESILKDGQLNNNLDINIINKLKEIFNEKSYQERLYIIKLLLLYIEGGLIINDKIILKNIDEILNLPTDTICFIKSSTSSNIFSGVMISTNKNNQELIHIITKYVQENNKPIDEYLLNNDNVLYLNETIVNNISYITFNNTVVAEHYFMMYNIEHLINNSRPRPNLNNLKIGITLSVVDKLAYLFNNGIRQNTLYFYELLNNMGYDVHMIITKDKEEIYKEITSVIDFYDYSKYTTFNKLFSENFDIVFSFGIGLPAEEITTLRKLGTKVIAYRCGNSYLIDSERILYNNNPNENFDNKFKNKEKYDQIWCIPQMYKQNKGYFEIINDSKCIKVPFVWSKHSVDFAKKIKNKQHSDIFKYKHKNNAVCILEPNLSVMKWCLPCILICEKLERKYKNLNKLFVTNIDLHKFNIKEDDSSRFNIRRLHTLCSSLDIFKKMSFEYRYNTFEMMEKYADIVVSFQWENPLNYLYLDLAWMGWPVLHNAYLCKDVGYYYDDHDYETASDILNEIIKNHSENVDEYIEKNRKVISRYLPTNKDLQMKYRKLINDLFS